MTCEARKLGLAPTPPARCQGTLVSALGANAIGAEVYAALRALLTEGGHATGLGDEGGFAPQITQPEQALELPGACRAGGAALPAIRTGA